MCSGCFGEYEENEDSESPSAADWSVLRSGAGPEHADPQEADDAGDHPGGEAHRSGRGGCDEDEFEVLVGVERIVEIRWTSAPPLGPHAFLVVRGAAAQAPERAKNQHSQGASAKNYQTALSRYCAEWFTRFGGSKYVLAGALTLFLLSALAFWFLRA